MILNILYNKYCFKYLYNRCRTIPRSADRKPVCRTTPESNTQFSSQIPHKICEGVNRAGPSGATGSGV